MEIEGCRPYRINIQRWTHNYTNSHIYDHICMCTYSCIQAKAAGSKSTSHLYLSGLLLLQASAQCQSARGGHATQRCMGLGRLGRLGRLGPVAFAIIFYKSGMNKPLVGGLEHEFYFSIYLEDSSQLTNIFQRD